MDQISDVTRGHKKSPRTKGIKQQNDAHTICSEIQDSQIECPPQELKLSDLAALDKNQQKNSATPRQVQSQTTKFKWTPKNTDLFFRLYVIFSGGLDLIENYFQRHINPEIPKGMMKKKFKKELKENPTKLYEKTKRAVQKDKIQQKMIRLAQRDLSLIKKWSSISEIDINQVVGVDDDDKEIQKNFHAQINQLLGNHKEIKQMELQKQ